MPKSKTNLSIDVITVAGTTKPEKLALPSEIFGVKVNPKLIAQAVRVYLANKRKAHAKTKTRGEVSGSGKKIWQQKGTGRARHGDRYAPIFVGGGIAHGPTGTQNYHLKISKTMKRKAFFGALTDKFEAGDIMVVKNWGKVPTKTREIASIFSKKLKLDGKILLVVPVKSEGLERVAKNIKNLDITLPGNLNTYSLLNHDKIVFSEQSLEETKKTFLGGK